MRAVVLGATGFIGGQIARALLDAGHEVLAFRRRPGPALALEGLTDRAGYSEAIGDMLDQDAVERALVGRDVLFHTAGYYPTNNLDPLRSIRDGVASVRSVFGAAQQAGVGRVVYTSSLSTIGRPRPGRDEADETDYYLPGSGRHSYPEAKSAMEQEAYRYIALGLPIVVLCPTAVFGPGDVKPTSGAATLAVARRQTPAYIEGKMNVVDVRDVAAAQVAAAERGRPGQKYILGGTNTTVGQLMATMAAEAGVPAPSVRLPVGLVYDLATLAEHLSSIVPGKTVKFLTTGVQQVRAGVHLSSAKADAELSLRHRTLETTIADSLVWFREHGYLG